jgi:hypothetical protein
MKISTPNFGKHSFSSPQKQAPKKVEKTFSPLKSIGTLVNLLLKFGQI